MGSCIICGTSVDGHICETHQQDAAFEFRGTSADQLTPGRFYRGTVDGYAEFGVFIDIADRVTGLLHRSELDQRLESLDWEPGDSVFVQVKNVRDNGNIDLGWSIRQSERDFRGTLIDDPDEDHAILAEEADDEEDTGPVKTKVDASAEESSSRSEPDHETSHDDEPSESGGGAVVEQKPEPGDLDVVGIETLEEYVGETVRIEGEVADIRQTSGPTVFEVRDEGAAVDCAAFKEAGVRAYPQVEDGDIVRLDGEVRRRRGELQVETEALVVLEDAERETVTERMADALTERARPDTVEPLAADPAVEAVIDGIREAATTVRRAVLDDRPVVVRHTATADGYVGGVALERAALPLIRDQHGTADAEYHYFDRRPLEDGVYDMEDATTDVTGMLDNRERHDEKLPLFVFVATGATRESLDGFDLLSVYGAERIVIDAAAADPSVAEAVSTVVSPSLAGSDAETTASALAATVAAHVNDDVREELAHLPAVSFWEDTPQPYVEAAEEYDEDTIREIREAITLEAFYQSYEDKRELIADLLFPETEDDRGLAGHISQQFRQKLDAEIDTAEANLDRREIDGVELIVLDTDAYAHRYEFPPTTLLLDELFRRHRDDVDVVVGLAADELFVRTDGDIDIRHVADQAIESVDTAGLAVRNARDGRLEFLSGERDAVLDAVLDAVAQQH